MKKPLFKPGFEFIFSLSLLAILGLPPLVFAQTTTKDLQININNGDTTINGKNIKELSAGERKDALKSINQISAINTNDTRSMVIITRKQKGDKGGDEIVVEKKGFGGGDEPLIADNDVNANGNKVRRMRIAIRRNGNDSTYAYSMNNDGGPKYRMEARVFRTDRDGDRPMGFDHRNTQNFMYTNTDNNGVSTHVNYRVSEHHATLEHDGGKQETTQYEMLDITDLNIVPEFSAGKTVLMFTLPSKAAAEVKLKDSKGNLVWSEKAVNGSFSKSFALGLNGMYYLQVKQGNRVAVKEIMKD